MFLAIGLSAHEDSHAAALDYINSSPYLMGDWSGSRTGLSDKGIAFDFTYTNEAAHNFSGGTHRSTTAAQQMEAGVTMDLDKLWGIKHSKFFLIMTDRFGNSLDTAAHLNTSMQTQEVYGRGQTVWLTKMTLDRTFFDGRLAVSVGRDSEGATFDSATCYFQSLAFCGAQGPNLYGSYWMSWPGSVWMGRARVNTGTATYVQFGVYQQSPQYYESGWERRNAWSPLSPNGTNGVVLPLEFGWTPQFWGKNGVYRVGVMVNTGGQPDLVRDVNGNHRALTNLSAQQSGTSYNAWISIGQRLTGNTNDGEGLNLGIRAVAGDRATSLLDRQMTMTLDYTNPFHQSGQRAGIAFAATHTSSRQGEYLAAYNALHPDDTSVVGHSYEYTTEIFYSWRVVPSVLLQPGLQFVLHPGGSSENSNVVVGTLKTVINF